MLKKQEIDSKVFEALSILKYYIQMNNETGNFDINKYCEDFLVDLLNLVYDINLINLNEIEVNFPAIDLGDKNSRICYQVTSTSGINKVEYTIDKFIEKSLYEEYDELNIFILGEKKNHTKLIQRDEIEFSYDRNLLDFNTLAVDIQNIKNLEKLNDIYRLLEESLSIYRVNLNDYENNQEDTINNIFLLLNDEIKSNIAALYSIQNYMNGFKFGIKEILETIKEDNFVPNVFDQPFPIAIETKEYDKVEQKLMTLPTKKVKWILDLYKAFKLINEKHNLLNLRADEYIEFRRVILTEMNKYYVKY